MSLEHGSMITDQALWEARFTAPYVPTYKRIKVGLIEYLFDDRFFIRGQIVKLPISQAKLLLYILKNKERSNFTLTGLSEELNRPLEDIRATIIFTNYQLRHLHKIEGGDLFMFNRIDKNLIQLNPFFYTTPVES